MIGMPPQARPLTDKNRPLKKITRAGAGGKFPSEETPELSFS